MCMGDAGLIPQCNVYKHQSHKKGSKLENTQPMLLMFSTSHLTIQWSKEVLGDGWYSHQVCFLLQFSRVVIQDWYFSCNHFCRGKEGLGKTRSHPWMSGESQLLGLQDVNTCRDVSDEENSTDMQVVWQRGKGAWMRLGYTWSLVCLWCANGMQNPLKMEI